MAEEEGIEYNLGEGMKFYGTKGCEILGCEIEGC